MTNYVEIKALEKIGLTKGEIKVYLALLKLGNTTAGPIVDEAKVTRSKIYDILERLKNKGLVSYITKNSTKYFSAANPSNILEYLNKKELEIKEDKKIIENILPQLLKEIQKKQKTIAEIYTGIKGMENAFNLLVQEFDAKEPYYAFGAGKGENVKQIQLFFSKLHERRINKKVKSYIIFNENSKGLFKLQEKSKFVDCKYLEISSPAAINIYKDYTIIAILNEEPITILIRNKETADSFREYFKIMWGSYNKN